jgi:Fe-S cluster biogenesis protein NfuA
MRARFWAGSRSSRAEPWHRRTLRRVALGLLLLNPPVGQPQQPHDGGDGDEHEQHLVPTALVGEDHSPDHEYRSLFPGDPPGPTGTDRVCSAGPCRSVRPSSAAARPGDFATRHGSVGPVRAQVEQTIEVIRPALQADGGDIILREVDEATGIVTVTLIGACGTCPASSQTLKAGIERIMRDRVDGVTEVVNV